MDTNATPLERAALALGQPDLHEVVRREPMALLVYTDEAEIVDRLEVPESQVERELARLNGMAPRESTYGPLKWRRGVTNYSDAGDRGLAPRLTGVKIGRGRDGMPIISEGSR